MRQAHFLRALSVAALLWIAAAQVDVSVASAQVEDGHDAEARALFAAGEAAFTEGRYEDALQHFERAYRLSRRSAMLYNIALAADRARLNERALAAFEQYLAENPTLPNRLEIEGRIRVLRDEVAVRAQPPETIAPPTPPVNPPPATSTIGNANETAGLALVIAGGALVVGGAVLVGLGVPDFNALQMPRPGESFAQAGARQDQGVALTVSGAVSLGVGAILGVVGAVLLASGGAEASSGAEASHTMRLRPDGFELHF